MQSRTRHCWDAVIGCVRALALLCSCRGAVGCELPDFSAGWSNMHACRYNISCYSSLLQQVDATADAELVFQQKAADPAAAQAALGPYGAVWQHPDDLQHLQQLQGQGASVSGSNASSYGVRASVVGLGAARYDSVGNVSSGRSAPQTKTGHGRLPGQLGFSRKRWQGSSFEPADRPGVPAQPAHPTHHGRCLFDAAGNQPAHLPWRACPALRRQTRLYLWSSCGGCGCACPHTSRRSLL